MTSHRLRAYFYLILVAAIWGAAGPVIKHTLPNFPPFIFLTYRFFISTIAFLPFVIFGRSLKLPKKTKNIILLLLIALLGSSLNLGLLFYGYSYTTALDASLLSATSPLFVVAAGVIFLNEKVTRKESVGLIVAFVGTFAIILQPLAEGNLFVLENILGNVLIIAANLIWVIYIIISKYELKYRVNPMTITFTMFLVGFITLLPFAIFQAGNPRTLLTSVFSAPLAAHAGVFYMAILSGNLAYFLYQKGQKSIEASEATLFGYLSPTFAAPLAVFWLGETITLPYAIGLVIIVLGVFIAETKNRPQKQQIADKP